jgi:hypothetical protein
MRTSGFRDTPVPDGLQHNLLSYISRVSFANHYFDLPAVASSAGLRQAGSSWRMDLKKAVSGQYDISRLARLMGASEEDIHGLTYPVAAGSTFGGRHLYLGHLVPWSSLDVGRPRYCPQCVEASPSYPRYWDIVWYTTCHKHRVPMVQRCGACDVTLEWSSWNWSNTCTHCGKTRSVAGQESPESAIECSAALSTFSAYSPAQDTGCGQRIGSLFELLSSTSQLSLAAIPRSMLGRFEFSPHLWSIEERQRLVAFTWPLRKDDNSAGAAIAALMTDSKRRYPHLDRDSHCLRLQHIVRDIPNEERRSRLLGQLCIARSQPRDQNNVSPEDNDDIATVSMVQVMLGTSRHNIMTLIKAGLLKGRFAHEQKRRSDWVVPIASVNELLGRFASVASPSTNTTGSSINTLARTPMGAALGGYSGIVAAICEGRLSVNAKWGDYRLSSLQVDQLSLLPTTELLRQSLTVPELMKRSGLYADAIYSLMKLGFLPYSREKRLTTPQRVVSVEDYGQFDNKYAVVTQIAADLKVNPTNLSDRLIDAGVLPVSGPRVDGGLINMFVRADLNSVDLQQILARTTYKSSAGRRRILSVH